MQQMLRENTFDSGVDADQHIQISIPVGALYPGKLRLAKPGENSVRNAADLLDPKCSATCAMTIIALSTRWPRLLQEALRFRLKKKMKKAKAARKTKVVCKTKVVRNKRASGKGQRSVRWANLKLVLIERAIAKDEPMSITKFQAQGVTIFPLSSDGVIMLD